MSTDDIVELAVVALVIVTVALGVAAVVAYRYLRSAIGDGIRRSRLLRHYLFRNRRVALAGAGIAFLGSYALLRFVRPDMGLPAIPSPWTTITIVVCIDLMLWGPISDAIAVYRMRREGMSPEDEL